LIATKFSLKTARKYQAQTIDVQSFASKKTIRLRILPILPMTYNGQ
jgi:hypothetical protein